MSVVSIRECSDYIYEDVRKAITMSLNDIGGLEKYIKQNTKVLLKVNLLMKKRPEEVATTHPMVVKVIAEELLNLGCEVIIADSPGGPYTESTLKGVYRTCGMEEVANELGIKLNYDTAEVKVENPNGKLLKYINVIKPIVDCDYVIDICKLKTHVLTTFTGGVKNLFGVIPGMAKAEYHMKMKRVEDFSNALVDICECVKPTLTIMDGIIGMEGEGPSAGKPRKVGVILASSNTYALDAIACKIINLDPMNAATVKRSIERKLISKNLDDIKLVGCRVEGMVIKDYIIPKSKEDTGFAEKMPKFMAKAMTPKPVVKNKECIGCKKCETVCPSKAITMNLSKPRFDLEKCIRCYCCHELCPQKAIEVKRPLLFKLIR